MLAIDTQKLEDDGFCALGRVISQKDLEEFEAQVARFSEAQIQATGTEPRAAESFIDVFSRGGAYTDRIYKLLERLQVLQAMSHRIGEDLEASGFLMPCDDRY